MKASTNRLLKYNTIFKTFDSDINKWTAKIGVFGRSFNKIGTAINDAFVTTIDNITNFEEDIGVWDSLRKIFFPQKKIFKQN